MIYETSFLFLPTLSGEDLAVQVGKLKEIITANGGEILSDEYPQMIGLAYMLRHRFENKYSNYETANFGWVKYSAEPEVAPKIKKETDLMKSLIRYLTIKSVEENTMVSKNVFGLLQGKEVLAAPSREESSSEAGEGEVVDEEVDEEISKIVDEEV